MTTLLEAVETQLLPLDYTHHWRWRVKILSLTVVFSKYYPYSITLYIPEGSVRQKYYQNGDQNSKIKGLALMDNFPRYVFYSARLKWIKYMLPMTEHKIQLEKSLDNISKNNQVSVAKEASNYTDAFLDTQSYYLLSPSYCQM